MTRYKAILVLTLICIGLLMLTSKDQVDAKKILDVPKGDSITLSAILENANINGVWQLNGQNVTCDPNIIVTYDRVLSKSELYIEHGEYNHSGQYSFIVNGDIYKSYTVNIIGQITKKPELEVQKISSNEVIWQCITDNVNPRPNFYIDKESVKNVTMNNTKIWVEHTTTVKKSVTCCVELERNYKECSTKSFEKPEMTPTIDHRESDLLTNLKSPTTTDQNTATTRPFWTNPLTDYKDTTTQALIVILIVLVSLILILIIMLFQKVNNYFKTKMYDKVPTYETVAIEMTTIPNPEPDVTSVTLRE
ncbi:uncharacterized protein [Antedon mediterranea]|uniref:uncharacterized protein n=1 Tax=Antedon mediterranea TaxID=105859 RepID=UPI003AF47D26